MPCFYVELHSEDLEPTIKKSFPGVYVTFTPQHFLFLPSPQRGDLVDELSSVVGCNFKPSQGGFSVLLSPHSQPQYQPPIVWFLLSLPSVLTILINNLLIIG